MKKVDGVEKVRVSLNDGLTILDLKPDNTVTLAALRQVIKDGGFVSKEATVVARGTPDGERFEVSGTGEQLAMSAPPVRSGDAWKLAVKSP